MKKPYSLRRNRSKVSFLAYGAAILFILVLIAIRMFAPNTFVTLASPFWNLGSSLATTVGDLSAGFSGKEKLEEQNVALAAQVQTLTNENEVLAARAEDLTTLLGGQSNPTGTVLAGVLAAPPESPYDTLMIAAGTNGGVVNDALVYSAGGIPIGTISQVNANSSQVALFSTPGRSVSGWVGANRIPITLIGMGAGAFSATVTASTSISVGDTVYVPGPGALPIGTVVRVENDPSSPMPIIDVQPLVNLFSITWVEVSHSSS